MKARVLLFSITVLLPLFLLGCKDKPVNKLEIGVVLPLTGPLSAFGEDEKNAINFALEESGAVNSFGLRFEDSKGTAKDALTAVKKLTSSGIDKIILSLTPPVEAVMSAYKGNDFLFFAQCMAPNVLSKRSNGIRVYLSVDNETTLMSDYCKKKSLKRIGILYINNDFGKTAIEQFKAKIEGFAEVVAEETFSFSDKDFRSRLFKLKEGHPDAILIYSYPQQWPVMLDQYMTVEYSGILLANSGIGFIAEDSKYSSYDLSKIIFAAPEYLSGDKGISEFRAKYKSKFGKDPNYDIIYFYDMMKLIIANIKPGKTNSEIRNGIISREHEGISGKLKFTAEGDLQIQNNLSLYIFDKEFTRAK